MRRVAALLFTAFVLVGTSVTGVLLSAVPVASASGTTYTPEAPKVDTIEGGPWNTSQGNPSQGGEYPSSDLLPTFAFGGPETTIGGVNEPNVAVYPSPSEKEPVIPYPSGVAGTPGPLSGYCNTEESENEKGSPVSQPLGSKLPFSPYYFPDIVRNADGSLTGYFDYRPKDADEAITVARSTDNGKTWVAEGKALEQNQGYCPTADTNDDGQGHPFVSTTGSTTDLYTLQRQAGDNPGIGLLVNQVNPSATNPLSTAPLSQPVGIDPNTFVTAATTVLSTGGVPVPVSTLGTAGTPEQIVNGSYEDVPAGSGAPSSSTIINCAGPTSAPSTEGPGSLTGCTSATGGSVELHPGDDLIQVIATGNPTSSSGSRDCATIGSLVPSGPNNPLGTGGISALCYSQPSTPVAPITDFLWGSLAPNRVYMNGETVYCNGVSSGRVKLENCTSTGAPFNYTAASEITGDPIIPPNATMTTGLEAPDGIIGSLGTGLTTYNGHSVPSGANVVLYTEKILNYYDVGIVNGEISKSGNYSSGKVTLPLSASFTSPQTQAQWLNYQPSPTSNEGVPAADEAPASGSFTVYVGVTDTSGNFIQPLHCTSWEPGSLTTGTKPPAGSVNLIGCNEQGTSAESIAEETEIGGQNAAIVPYSVLGQTGEGKNGKTSGPTELFGNNEDLSLVRAAYTTNGVSFTDLGAISGSANGSGEDSGTYTDLSNPNQQESPENSANPTVGTTSPTAPTNLSSGSTDTVEMRYIGSRGTIVTNPDGSYGMFLSGAWPSDGDSDAFNQIFYTSSTDGVHWTPPVVVLSTDYTFSASAKQDEELAKGEHNPLGVSAYYSGRAYGPAVVQNPNGSLTMVFSGYRLPKPTEKLGTELGTSSPKYKIGEKDPAIYRNILTTTLTSSTSPLVGTSTLVTSSQTPVNQGTQVTYTATVSVPSPGTGTPTGTVSFSDGGTPISGCQNATLSDGNPDTATCTTAPPTGTQSITATYSGDSNYANSSGTTTETVDEAPAITSANETTFTEGTAGSFTVTASGYPAPAITESGTLPGGVEFKDGVLSGTPTEGGVYPITFKASNGIGAQAEQSFTLTVDAAPAIISAESTTFTEGEAGSFTVTATGTPSPTLSEEGTLPHGVSFEASTGVLSGIPTQDGTYPITFKASNGIGAQAEQSFTLTVDAAPAITSANETTFTEGSAGSFTVTASGNPTPLVEMTAGKLPTGVEFDALTDVLSGTPTEEGVYHVTFEAANGVGSNATQSFTLAVEAPPKITSADEATFNDHASGTFTVMATGTPAPAFSKWGTLPEGVTFSDGVLSGTPTQIGTFQITFTASNGIGSNSTQQFTLTVVGLHITTTSLPEATPGKLYSPQQLEAVGGVIPYHWKRTAGSLPKGLALSTGGDIYGTVSKKAQAGPYQFTVTVTDSTKKVHQTATKTFTLVVS